MANRSTVTYIKNIFSNAVQYRLKSIFVQNFILCVALIIVPVIAMNVAFYFVYTNNIKTDFNTKNTTTLSRTANAVDNIMSSVNNSIMLVINDENVLHFFDIDYASLSLEAQLKSYSSIKQTLKTVSTSNNYIESAYVYSMYNDFALSKSNGNSPDLFEDSAIINIIKGSRPTQTTVLSRSLRFSYEAPKEVITVITPVYPELTTSGYIIVNLSSSKLSQTVEAMLDSQTEDQFVVLTDKQMVIYHSYRFGPHKDTINPATPSNTQFYKQASDSLPYEYQLLVSNKPFVEKNIRITQILILFGVLSLLITFAFSLLITLKTSRPIGNILDIIENPDEWADNQQLISANSQNEMNLIVTNLLDSFHLARNMPEQTAIRTALLKKAQTIALQAQINPHFLFNTLEAIYLSAADLTGGENETTEMVSALSDLLRLSFKTKEILVPIRSELELTQKYVKIQLYRYEGMFEMAWKIDRAILDSKIVKLSLQPFVENALYHGIKPAGRKCTITISGRLKGNQIHLEISDDGVGIPPEKLLEIRQKLSDTSLPEDESIGITNVHRRIRLTFGEPYGVSVRSANGKTSFLITLPSTAPDHESQ